MRRPSFLRPFHIHPQVLLSEGRTIIHFPLCISQKWTDQRQQQQQHLQQQTAAFRRGHAASAAASASDPPPFLRESPLDTSVARGVKRGVNSAYSSVDKLSLRIGVALRRYPLARIFVIAYMVRKESPRSFQDYSFERLLFSLAGFIANFSAAAEVFLSHPPPPFLLPRPH